MKVFKKFFAALFICGILGQPIQAISLDEEIRLGSEAAAQFEQQYGLVTDPVMVARLERVGQAILANAQRKDLPWRLRVINIEAFNAAAFPGGFIYATKGLMDGLNDEELAFVVGHEIGHVDYNHSIRQIEAAQRRRLGLIAIAAGIGKGNIDRGASTLVQLTDSVIGSQRSQGDESEADRYGMKMMALAGYDPAYSLSALQKLGAQKSGGTPGFLNTLLGSHPLPKDRINQSVKLIPTIAYQPQISQPVPVNLTGEERFYRDANQALEYSLSLLGHNFRPALQTIAEDVALNRRAAPGNTRLLRVVGTRSAGLPGLENEILASTELKKLGQAFGAVVVDNGGGQIEAVIILQGGR